MRKPRKPYTPAEKVAILRRHLIDKVPVSDLCDEHRLSPTLFYAWQRTFFENGAAAFERQSRSAEAEHQRTIAALRDKLRRKDEVVSELMEEHVRLKKSTVRHRAKDQGKTEVPSEACPQADSLG
jgi:transposase-like protein